MAKKSNKTINNDDLSATKKAAVLSGEKKDHGPGVLVFVGLGLALGLGAWLLIRGLGVGGSDGLEITNAQAGVVSLAATQFEDGQARHFSFKTPQGITVRYFVLKSSDGVIRAAFDACDVCWPEGKGYRQEGDFMVCNNCGQRFASRLVNEVKGGCNPAPLGRAVKNGQVLIEARDLAAGTRFFGPGRRG